MKLGWVVYRYLLLVSISSCKVTTGILDLRFVKNKKLKQVKKKTKTFNLFLLVKEIL